MAQRVAASKEPTVEQLLAQLDPSLAPEAPPDEALRLKAAWLNEKHAPELLPYEAELVEALTELLENQRRNIGIVVQQATDPSDQFAGMLYQMEVDRVTFILRSYLRTRLAKIDRFALSLLADPDLDTLLSADEQAYCKAYVEAFQQHMETSVLSMLPNNLRSLSEQTAAHDMIPRPDLDEVVYLRALEDLGELDVSDRGSDSADITVSVEKDSMHVMAYRKVRQLLRAKQVQLI